MAVLIGVKSSTKRNVPTKICSNQRIMKDMVIFLDQMISFCYWFLWISEVRVECIWVDDIRKEVEEYEYSQHECTEMLESMGVFPVTHFVTEHSIDLSVLKLIQECIIKHNSFVFSKSKEVCIRVRTTGWSVNFEEFTKGEFILHSEFLDSSFKLTLLKFFVFVEQWSDEVIVAKTKACI